MAKYFLEKFYIFLVISRIFFFTVDSFVLLAVVYDDVTRVFFGYPRCHFFGTIDGAVLTAGAAEGNLQGGEVALEVFLDALGNEGLGMVKKAVDGGFFLQEFYHGAILAGVGLVFGITAGIGEGTAVEDEATAIAGGIGGEALFVAEAEDADGQRRIVRRRIWRF